MYLISSPSLDTAVARSIRYFRLHIPLQEDMTRHIRNSICVMRALTVTYGSRPTKFDVLALDASRKFRLNR